MAEELDQEMLEFEKRYGTGDKGDGNGGDGGKAKTVVKILAVVAAVLGIVLAFTLISNLRLIGELKVDKENLTTELISLQADYDTLTTNNAALNDSLAVEKEKVGQLIERLKKTEATNRSKIRQYEKELGTLRTIMKSYINQIDSLNTLNIALRHEASEARKDAAQSKKKYNELVSTTEKYAAKASAGAVVRGRGLALTAINSSAKETDRSSRTVKLKACISLIENSIAEKGDRRVYLRVFNPSGEQIVSDRNSSFTSEGDDMIASASRVVDYQGEEIEICIFFVPSGAAKFVKGVYTAEIYTEEAKLGTAELLLR